MNRLRHRSGWLWLALFAAIVFVHQVSAPGFHPVTTQDTRSYVWTRDDLGSGRVLTSSRTFAYPLFLSAVRTVTGDDSRAAAIQLAIYCVAVVAFGAAVEIYTGSRLIAAAAAVPLFFAPIVAMEATRLQSETLAAAMVVTTVAFLLRVVARPGSGGAWAGLGLALFLSYQVRPACLFLVALVPLLGWVLGRRRDPAGQPQGRRVLALALLALVPFLSWCTLRWAAVGHFGLVSFGGANIVGVTSSMVTPETIPRLAPEYREFARILLVARARLGLRPQAADVDYARWVLEFNRNAYHVARKALRIAAVPSLHGAVDANRYYTRFSLAVIRSEPGLYLRWITAGWHATWTTLAADPGMRATVWLLALAACWSVGVRAFGRAGGNDRPDLGAPAVDLAIAALGFFLASQSLVLLVIPALPRYTFLSALFLPGAALALACQLASPRAAGTSTDRDPREPRAMPTS